MDTARLKKFAQTARRSLIEQVSARLASVLRDDSSERRELPEAITELEREIRQYSEETVIERAAYIWFNRFTALMFMDMNNYTSVRTVSPSEGESRPALLSAAMSGQIDSELPEPIRQQVTALLDGSAPSREPEAEAYRLLLVAVCNQWHASMPFMFETISDWSELLMPVDLLSASSILSEMRKVMTIEACQDVEIIGWLYQFYISEKKDGVFAGLKKNIKITPENIPAATQLFTPHWIVRYLVENSLGRLWLLNNPQSGLAAKMDYYIAPEEPETDFLRIARPEDIRICDPAAGSGHMLTYAFDLLYAIYEEEGYDATEIPALILTHNLTGVEIDDRAGALAAFALAMKAAGKLGRRRFLRIEVNSGSGPDICVLQNVSFTDAEMQDVAAVVGKDLFTDELRDTLGQFEQAKNFGSLIVPKLRDPAETLRVVEARDFGGDLLLKEVQVRVIAVLRMAEALSPKYHVVVANPPYMGARNMNPQLKKWTEKNYPDSRTDLFALFMERSLAACAKNGYMAMINMQSWMFLSSFEKLRAALLSKWTILTMAHLGERAFDTIGGAVVSTTAFVCRNTSMKSYDGAFIRAISGRNESEKQEILLAAAGGSPDSLFRISQSELVGVPGTPIAYWLSESVREAFGNFDPLRSISVPRQGNTTTDNERFVRFWPEVSKPSLGTDFPSAEDFNAERKKWAPYNKGGGSRRWYGQNDSVVNWEQNGREIKAIPHSVTANEKSYFSPGLTWSTISTNDIGFRHFGHGFLFDNKGACIFVSDAMQQYLASLLNTKVFVSILYQINPTVSLQPGDVAKFPVIPMEDVDSSSARSNATACINLAKSDWDSYETSWDFTTLPLLQPDHRAETLEGTYTALRTHWQGMTDEMLTLEEENNRIFIDAYGLQDELTPEVPLNEITLTCNPAYRYGIKNDAAANETRLRADTIAEFLSYAVGCMFGRYSLDAPGLILANQGETLADYLARVPEPTFMPDDDHIIPILEDDWFPDDITERFRSFLEVTFGKANLQENLEFVEEALGKPIRKYFLKDFYKDHLKRYKKRPIYWLFSSPGKSFNALIYMHRYRADTVSVILNDYLRAFRGKLEARLRELGAIETSASSSARDKSSAAKERESLNKVLREIDAYERDTLFPLAEAQIEIDLDDGVKANYPKFGNALFSVKGLNA